MSEISAEFEDFGDRGIGYESVVGGGGCELSGVQLGVGDTLDFEDEENDFGKIEYKGDSGGDDGFDDFEGKFKGKKIQKGNMFYGDREDILEEEECFKCRRWTDDPEGVVFAFRLFGQRMNIQRCECFQLIVLVMMVLWIATMVLRKRVWFDGS